MAASSSKEAHHIPLPPSPSAAQEPKASTKKKGKQGHTKRRVPPKSAVATKTPRVKIDSGSDWDWTPLTDSHVSKVPPLFTKDGSYFFSLVGPSVKIYSVATGHVVSTLSAPRLASLTCAVLNPHNAFQLITGSTAGRLHIWDFLEGTLLRTIDLGQPIQCICAHEKFKDHVFVAMMRPASTTKSKKSKDGNAVVLKVSLDATPEMTAIGKTKFPTGLSISASGSWIVATAGHKSYVAALTTTRKPHFTKYVSPERITCLALHPSEDYFATGDAKGNIRLWYCLNDEHVADAGMAGVEKRTQTASLHWHAHSVASLAFTGNGAYLVSGGEEAVLVVWQLESGKKEFVPRLGAPINAVSVVKSKHEEEYLVGLVDGTYLFVTSGLLQVARSYSRIRLDPISTSSKNATSLLASHSAASTLILPSSHPSSLQIFSIPSSRIISELEVTPSNRVSRRDGKPVEPSRIEATAIASCGDWMATVDRREGDSVIHSEIYLKIWRWDRPTGAWTLNTRIDRPHGVERVTDVAFSPVGLDSRWFLLVTTGEDGNVKMWRFRESKDQGYWVARSTFGFRSQTPKQVSWAPDGSLLAVSFDQHVILYDPISTLPQRVLSSPECPHVSSSHFVGPTGRYLVVQSGRDISLWDLVTHSVSWHTRHPLPIDKILPSGDEDKFTVVSTAAPTATRLAMYDCESGSGEPRTTRGLPFALRGVVLHEGGYVGVSQEWNLVLFGEGVKKREKERRGGIGAAVKVGGRSTLFQDIFGKSAFERREDVVVVREDPGFVSSVPVLFDGPSYMMPPLESLFDDAMGGFIRPRAVDTDVPTVDAEGDVEMEEPEDVHTKPRRPTRKPVDQTEMDAFVSLFREHSLQPKQRAPPPVVRPTNGVSKTPGKTNGHSVSKRAPVVPSTPTSLPPSSPTMMVNGKKRKKVE